MECARCGRGLGKRRQANFCGDCQKAINTKESSARQYTAGELAEALSVLPLEDRKLPVIVGGREGPDSRLFIQVCRNADEAYVWIGDPDV